jgi:nucleotide-binding universal stress UspA family protein
MRILVPLDGSELAESALDLATRMAHGARESVSLLLTRVIPTPPVAFALNEAIYTSITQDAYEAADDYLRAVAHYPAMQDVACERYVVRGLRQGNTAHALTELAQSHHCDLIVICSHGRTGLMRVMIGSVAQELAWQATIPTVILRPSSHHGEEIPFSEPFQILVGLDGSPLAEQIIAPAFLIAQALHGSLRLCRVLQSSYGSITKDQEHFEAAKAYLAQMARQIAVPGVEVHTTIAIGLPAQQIEEKARKMHCSMIALATHGQVGAESFFVGSTTEWMIDHSRLPLLIVRPQKVA